MRRRCSAQSSCRPGSTDVSGAQASLAGLGVAAVLFMGTSPVAKGTSAEDQRAISRLRFAISYLQSVYLRRPALLGGTMLLSALVQAANVILVWLVGLAIDAPVPAAYFGIAVPMVTLLTLLPVSLNGMGLREGGLVLFLQPLGVPAGTALSLAFLWFLVFTAVSLMGGGVYLFGRFPRPEVQTDHGPVRSNSDQGRAGQYCAAA